MLCAILTSAPIAAASATTAGSSDPVPTICSDIPLLRQAWTRLRTFFCASRRPTKITVSSIDFAAASALKTSVSNAFHSGLRRHGSDIGNGKQQPLQGIGNEKRCIVTFLPVMSRQEISAAGEHPHAQQTQEKGNPRTTDLVGLCHVDSLRADSP